MDLANIVPASSTAKNGRKNTQVLAPKNGPEIIRETSDNPLDLARLRHDLQVRGIVVTQILMKIVVTQILMKRDNIVHQLPFIGGYECKLVNQFLLILEYVPKGIMILH